jgi:hypothetical protein
MTKQFSKPALEADHYAFSTLYLQAEIYDAKGDHDHASKVRSDAAVTGSVTLL